MPQHISIGAVFSYAWQSLKHRFASIILLSLVQTCWAPVLTLWQYLPEGWNIAGVWQDRVLLACLLPFLVASMAIVLQVDARENDRPAKAALLMRRFVPTLVAVLIYLALVVAIGAVLILGMRFLPWWFGFGVWRFVFVFAAFVIMIASAIPFFVLLPVAVLETGGPLRAVGRSFALTRKQRWRIGAIVLTLAMLVIVLTAILFWASFTYGPVSGEHPHSQMPLLDIGSALLWWLHGLTLTLLIASTYQLTTRLRDGIAMTSTLWQVFE